MRSIYGILFGTLFIIFAKGSFLDQAISLPDDPQALYNAGTDLYLQNDYTNSICFLERAKNICASKSSKNFNSVNDLAENISLNLAHSLVKAEKYQEALAEYKDLYLKFKNPKAEKNIPILEKFLQQQQDQQNQDSKDQDNKDQDNKEQESDNKSNQSKDNFKQKNEQKKDEKLNEEPDKKEQKFEQKNQKNPQKKDSPDTKKNPAHSCDPINSENKSNNKQKTKNHQPLDQDEQKLLEAIENFDQDMMKMYAAANCGGSREDGW